MYSLWHRQGSRYQFALLFFLKERQNFYLLHTKYHLLGFHFVPRKALNLMIILWNWVPWFPVIGSFHFKCHVFTEFVSPV